MNKETVRKNLKLVFRKEETVRKAIDVRIDAQDAENDANDVVRDARSFLRKSIEDIEEVYIVDINGIDYKIELIEGDNEDIIIKEIEIIK